MQVLENRCIGTSKLSLVQINQLLDDIVKSFDNKQKKVIISNILKNTTQNEQKYVVRIILKDLKLGIGHQSILKSYH